MAAAPPAKAQGQGLGYQIVVHGGAGDIRKGSFQPGQEQHLRATLATAVEAGRSILARGGSSVDAVEATIRVMEDSGEFDAGKGAAFTSTGTVEVVAAIMDGSTLKAGGVADVTHVANPIALARVVMEKSPYVLMVGEGAESFAQKQGMTLVPQEYFMKHQSWYRNSEGKGAEKPAQLTPQSHDTVGVVARDRAGHLAAGTSSGGIMRQWPGRVGDSPLIGAGRMRMTRAARFQRPASASFSFAPSRRTRSATSSSIGG